MPGEAAQHERKLKDMTLSEINARLRPMIIASVREAIAEEVTPIVDTQIQDRMTMMIKEGFLAAGPLREEIEEATNVSDGGILLPPGLGR